MDQETGLVINKSFFHHMALAHIGILNSRRDARGAVSAITNPNTTCEMALQYHYICIIAASTVDIVVLDVEETESRESLMIQGVPLMQYMGKCTEGLRKMG